MTAWSNLATVVYKRTYSRKDSGTPENWPDTVERVIGGNVRGWNVPQQEIDRLRFFMLNRKAGPAGRGLWFSGAPAHKALGGVALNNCFRGSEQIITKEGPKSLETLTGTEAEVWTKEGWIRAFVRSFGEQPLQQVVMVPAKPDGRRYRSNHRITVTVTPNHTWILKDGSRTINLKVGDLVPTSSVQGPRNEEQVRQGLIHGLIFGDGTRANQRQDGSFRFHIRMCGARAQAHKDLFSDVTTPPTYNGDPVGRVDSVEDLKEFPIDKGADYLYGFLKGWMDADGNWSKETPRLSSQHPRARQWLETYAATAGMVLTGFSANNPTTNFGIRKNPLYTYTLTEAQDLLWKVESINALPEPEEVYCAMVPGPHAFTLASGIYTSNCWFVTGDDWMNFITAADLLMLGGGVGMSVEHKYVSKLQRIKKNVVIKHKLSRDAIFIVPDSREGWVELIRRVLKAYFYDGKGFEYSTVCIRGANEPIKGFGGTASGPLPLIALVEKLCSILEARAGRHIHPIDAADILCAIGEMVVSGNVRRSALILLGDCFDKEFLKAKRWDLGPLPTQRSKGNFSVICDDVDDLHPLFWQTYEIGEPFGVVNRTNIQKYGRMGELKKDTAIGVNPCVEATIENNEGCNLQEIPLPNLDSVEEFEEAGRLMHRYGRRVVNEHYHIPACNEVMHRNQRVGTGITGCMISPLFVPETLDRVYAAIQDENRKWSKEHNKPESVRTTAVKPSGTWSKIADMDGYEGIHVAISRYCIQRIRFAASDPAIPRLRAAGHHIEPLIELDGSLNHNTVVVDFYVKAPDGYPVADEDWNTWKQLDVVLLAQKHWSDQAVSVTVYYKREEIPQLKEWLSNNLKYLKGISFLCAGDHGFKQAPKEAITKEQYEQKSRLIKTLSEDDLGIGADLEGTECGSGACPIR